VNKIILNDIFLVEMENFHFDYGNFPFRLLRLAPSLLSVCCLCCLCQSLRAISKRLTIKLSYFDQGSIRKLYKGTFRLLLKNQNWPFYGWKRSKLPIFCHKYNDFLHLIGSRIGFGQERGTV